MISGPWIGTRAEGLRNGRVEGQIGRPRETEHAPAPTGRVELAGRFADEVQRVHGNAVAQAVRRALNLPR
jgi:hypothetical protein